MTTTSYSVSGMTCGHCTAAVTEELTKLDGVQQVSIDLNAGGNLRRARHQELPSTTPPCAKPSTRRVRVGRVMTRLSRSDSARTPVRWCWLSPARSHSAPRSARSRQPTRHRSPTTTDGRHGDGMAGMAHDDRVRSRPG